MAGSVLSDAQIIALWVLAGGSLSTAPQALARALSESGGRTAVTSGNPDGGTNVGLYQLDTKGVGSGYTEQQLANPYLNTQITVKATRGGADWGPWADNWQNFIGGANTAVASWASTAGGNVQGYAAGLTKGLTTSGAGGAGQNAGGSSGGSGGGGFSLWPSSVTGFFDDADHVVGDLYKALTALLNPATWVRAGAGLVGAMLLILGMAALYKAAK